MKGSTVHKNLLSLFFQLYVLKTELERIFKFYSSNFYLESLIEYEELKYEIKFVKLNFAVISIKKL